MHTPGPWILAATSDSDTTRPWNLPATSDSVATAIVRDGLKAPDLRAALAWALAQIEDDLAPEHQAALAHARSLLED